MFLQLTPRCEQTLMSFFSLIGTILLLNKVHTVITNAFRKYMVERSYDCQRGYITEKTFSLSMLRDRLALALRRAIIHIFRLLYQTKSDTWSSLALSYFFSRLRVFASVSRCEDYTKEQTSFVLLSSLKGNSI